MNLEHELASNVELLDQTLATQDSAVRVDGDRLVVSPLQAVEDQPDERLRDQIHGLLPQVDLVDVLVEVNAWTGYLDAFTHASSTSRRTEDHTARLLAVREATYLPDAIFDNETDLDIEEHTTDTAGYTDLVFGLFDLVDSSSHPALRPLKA